MQFCECFRLSCSIYRAGLKSASIFRDTTFNFNLFVSFIQPVRKLILREIQFIKGISAIVNFLFEKKN